MCLDKWINWVNKKIRKLVWYDLSLIKLSTAAFVLMIAKLWTPLLNFEWYYFGIVALIAGAVPFKKIFMR